MQLLGVIVEERGSLYIVTEYMAKVCSLVFYTHPSPTLNKPMLLTNRVNSIGNTLIFCFVCLIQTKMKAMLLVIMDWINYWLGVKGLPGSCYLIKTKSLEGKLLFVLFCSQSLCVAELMARAPARFMCTLQI